MMNKKILEPKFYGYMIPRLSEVLEILKSKVRFMIELKDSNTKDEILNIVKTHRV